MKLLRETIRKLLLESTCGETNNKIYHAIQELEHHNLKLEYDLYRFKHIVIKILDDNLQPIAEYVATKGGDSAECLQAFITGHAEVEAPYKGNSGFGALMYDVAFEMAGKSGLTSDRVSVSDDAYRNWEYFKNSEDYEKKLLDTAGGHFTDPDIDDCTSNSWVPHMDNEPQDAYTSQEWLYDYKEDFQASPLNTVYYKKDQSQPTINCLKERGLIE